MILLETILLATDFSKGFQPAADTAVALAKTFQSKVVLVHAIPDSMLPFLSDDGDVAQIEEHLLEVAKQIEAKGIERPEIALEKGAPAEVVCKEAARREANLIVLGCRTGDSGDQVRPGVTAERVLRRATTPVWLARPGVATVPRRVLCTTDTSRASKRALKNALVLCRKLKASLAVLNVQEPIPAGYSWPSGITTERNKDVFGAREKDFNKFLSAFDFTGVDWIKRIRKGIADKEILSEAAEQKADLVVMGTVGKSGVERVVIGSVTQRVLRNLPCSALMMKEEDVIRLRLECAVASIDEHMQLGQKLLEDGLTADALQEFEQCLLSNPTYAVAWDGKALAYERLGDKQKSDEAKTTAKRIRDTLWQRRVEAEIRSRHDVLGG